LACIFPEPYVDKVALKLRNSLIDPALYCLLQDHRKEAVKVKAVSQEMSDLVVYCISKPFQFPMMLTSVLIEEEMDFRQMSSFAEGKGKDFMIDSTDAFNRKKGKGG
jgi:hypothetical protein